MEGEQEHSAELNDPSVNREGPVVLVVAGQAGDTEATVEKCKEHSAP